MSTKTFSTFLFVALISGCATEGQSGEDAEPGDGMVDAGQPTPPNPTNPTNPSPTDPAAKTCATDNPCGVDNACVDGTHGMECLALSCDGILAESPNAPDGEYILNVGGSPDHPWSAYCADMSSGSPAEYLTLVNTWFGENAATFQPGGAATGTPVMTSYTKLRIDPLTLEIDLDDARFTTTQGSISYGGTTVTSMPYGVAMGCNSNWQAGANIDLRMTPFRFDGPFLAGASVTASAANQLFSILGGSGACDVNGPAGISQQPYNGHAGGRMQLTYDK